MRQKLFKMIFSTSMSVCLISAAILSVWMYRSVDEVGVLELFSPIVTVTVLGVILSLLLAVMVSRSATKSLGRIDLSRPDERDVEEEIKPLFEGWLIRTARSAARWKNWHRSTRGRIKCGGILPPMFPTN